MVDMLHEVAETGDIEDKVDNHETGLQADVDSVEDMLDTAEDMLEDVAVLGSALVEVVVWIT